MLQVGIILVWLLNTRIERLPEKCFKTILKGKARRGLKAKDLGGQKAKDLEEGDSCQRHLEKIQ